MEFHNSTESMMPTNETIHPAVTQPAPPFDIARNVHFVLCGIIVPLGLIFNVFSLVVIATSAILRKTTTGRYLLALSAADTIYLTGEFIRWLNATNTFVTHIHFINSSHILCKLIYFIRYGGKLTSSWITVVITTERLLMVAFPLKYSRLSTTKSAKIVICVTFVICFVLASFPFWSLRIMMTPGYRMYCGIHHKVWYEIGSWVTLRIGSLLLPGVIVLIMTSIIIYHMMTARTRRNRRLSARRTMQRQDTMEVSRASLENQLTTMLVTVAIAFIILRLPYAVVFYFNEYKEEIWIPLDKWFSYKLYFANKMADTLATLNYATNFFLYFVCGSVFRKQVRNLFKLCITCNPRGNGKRFSTPLSLFSHYTRSRHSNRTRDDCLSATEHRHVNIK